MLKRFSMAVILSRMTMFSTLLVAFLGLAGPAQAAGPVVYQDCTLAWNPNTDSDLAGYRVYVGRISSLLNQVRDVGSHTSIRCSEIGATANGQWFGAVTAYDTSGNESTRSQVLPFELNGFPNPATPPQVSEPAFVHLAVREPGFQLTWADTNLPPVSYRIETSSSLQPNWTSVTVQPPGVTRFNYFQPHNVEWVCYRVRGESGAIVSPWAQAGGPNDRQFCFQPTRIATIEQPILVPAVFLEPRNVRLTAKESGFELTWDDPGATPLTHRIEGSGSVDTRWTPLAVLPLGTTTFTIDSPIDAAWVCVRVRAEQQRVVSLWAMSGGLLDRQFCFRP